METMLMQHFRGTNKEYCGIFETGLFCLHWTKLMKYLDFEVNIMKVIVSIVHRNSAVLAISHLSFAEICSRLACMLHVQKVFYVNLVFDNVAVMGL